MKIVIPCVADKVPVKGSDFDDFIDGECYPVIFAGHPDCYKENLISV